MKKGELAKMAFLSSNAISKLAKNENVSLDVLIRVCTALNVDFCDIMELVPDEKYFFDMYPIIFHFLPTNF
ncbi:helix-turn-helix transcriptional regulator [Zhenpiania hominis]|uniref:helix-turn-helix domain-containing protein n=1 Tax=Zhenpiania hominis TaxID=2763644 RepID=UPI003211B49D